MDQIQFYKNTGILYSIELVKLLRLKHRLLFYPIGSNPQKRKQVKVLLPPFITDSYTLTLIFAQNLFPISLTEQQEVQLKLSQNTIKFKVFSDLYSKGFFVSMGGKFGADFIIYEQDPLLIHGCALVFVKGTGEMQPIEVNRLST